MAAYKVVLIGVLGLFLASCKPKVITKSKEVQQKSITADSLFLLKNNVPFQSLLIKGKGKSEGAGPLGFSYRIQIQKDEKIWASITALGLEGMRLLVTKDSVKIINRLKQEYIAEDWKFMSKQLGFEVELGTIQGLLLGNSFVPPKLVCVAKQPQIQYSGELNSMNLLLFLNQTSCKMEKISGHDPKLKVNSEFNYSNFQALQNYSVPMNIQGKIKNGTEEMIFELNHKEVNLQPGELKFNFEIPSDYKKAVNEKK